MKLPKWPLAASNDLRGKNEYAYLLNAVNLDWGVGEQVFLLRWTIWREKGTTTNRQHILLLCTRRKRRKTGG